MLVRIATKASCLLLFCLVVSSAKAQLSADFTATPTSGCAPMVVRFTDLSTGNPTQWRWDLGNGTISFLQNPSVTYFNPGLYNIKLVVRRPNQADSIVKTQYIRVNAKPTVQFTASPLVGCYPLPVQFTDQSIAGSGTITLWQWDFGDGFSSSQQNPTHIYNAAGNYNVTLRIRNSNDCFTTLTKTSYVRISAGVLANFTAGMPSNCGAPANVTFQNLSSGTGALTYHWDFGDGDTSTAQHPTHTYNALGSYTVQLVVTNTSGCRDTIRSSTPVNIQTVSASFEAPDTLCAGSPGIFTNTSSPTPLSVVWDFGDGTTSTDLNPSKTFSAPGTYIIKLVSDFGPCKDSATQSITINPLPTVDFTTSDTLHCGRPYTVSFNNASTGGVSYLWDFGDNTTSTDANPVHVYDTTGHFTVQLTVFNANACSTVLVKNNLVNITGPSIQLTSVPDSGCAPFVKHFAANITSPDPIASYLWNFGDGNTSTDPAPDYTYSNTGTYAVSLVVTTVGGCMDSIVVPRGIIVNSTPVVNFSATPTSTCAETPVVFTDLSPGTNTSWLWNFGDGNMSPVHNPLHQYVDTGYFDVTLTVWNGGCKDSIKFIRYIHIDPPIAKFQIVKSCQNPYLVTFTDQSIGADQYFWDFGDGSTSNVRSPQHTYADTGSYVVELRVVNNRTGCEFTTRKPVLIIDIRPSFSASDTIICKGTNVLFSTPHSLTQVKNFYWNFSDGPAQNITASNSVNHRFNNSGVYTITLITTDVNNCKDTLIKRQYITVFGPKAKFGSTVPGTCLNSQITFIDSSTTDGTHPIQSWFWDYRDGITETLTSQPFQHTYITPGSYLVKLRVTDSYGCTDSVTLRTPIQISRPSAQFSIADSISCMNKPLLFVNNSSGPGLTYTWNFGDGSTSSLQNPVHFYQSEGHFNVSLFITDQFGCTDFIQKDSFITIANPVARFAMSDSFSTCPPLVVQFTNQSLSATSTTWDFGDGSTAITANPSHFYNYPGDYVVTLKVTSRGGCIDSTQKTIHVKGPKGTFTYNPLIGCVPMTVNFTSITEDRATILWDYNDGTTQSTTIDASSHVYTYPGVYVPQIILSDTAGCQVPIVGADTIVINGAIARFDFINRSYCDSGSIVFSDSSVSNDLIVSYNWNFGDGNTSTLQNPQHPYQSPGSYFPVLTIATENGCVDSFASPNPVRIVASPVAQINAGPNGCAPLTASFNGTLQVPDTSAIQWQWTFNNGNTSTAQQPAAQIFNTAGNYTVTLTATNSSGCTDTTTATVSAYAIPVVGAGSDTIICERRGIPINATGASTYTWWPATGLSCVNCASPIANPDSITTYHVTGTSAEGCSANDTIVVRVKYPFTMTVGTGATLCKGGSKVVSATGANSYVWTPSSGLSSNTAATVTAQPDTTTNYMVVGTDDRGCFKDTGYVFFRVYPIPVVEAGDDKIVNVGSTIDLIPTISPDVTEVIWSPTTGVFRNTYPGISVKPTQNTEYTVDVKNAGGCASRDKVTVYVICDGANVFIPNTFSPNNDGMNDVFYPRGSGLFKIRNLRIFNRWGEVLFERNSFNANDAASGWDGTFKAVKQPADVYVYTIDIICDNNSILTYKGNIALLR